ETTEEAMAALDLALQAEEDPVLREQLLGPTSTSAPGPPAPWGAYLSVVNDILEKERPVLDAARAVAKEAMAPTWRKPQERPRNGPGSLRRGEGGRVTTDEADEIVAHLKAAGSKLPWEQAAELFVKVRRRLAPGEDLWAQFEEALHE